MNKEIKETSYQRKFKAWLKDMNDEIYGREILRKSSPGDIVRLFERATGYVVKGRNDYEDKL